MNAPNADMSGAKPPYAVPSMDDIRSVKPNGLKVVSTFSGCGGTCLGYRMAGFEIIWASEFIPAAQDTYRFNSDAPLDTHDIREVEARDILNQIGMDQGDIDILEGSPPCASFSTAGKREAGWGKVVKYSETKQRVDDLFDEYTRLVNDLQPKVFVAENVYGLVRGSAKGYFKQILRNLQSCGYRVEVRLLDAAWLGVPQHRRRLFFMGVRNDLGIAPAFPKPWKFQYTLRDVMPWIRKVNVGRGFYKRTTESSPVIMAHQHGELAYGDGSQWIEADRWYADTDITSYAIGKEWDKLKPGEQSEKYFSLVKPALDAPIPTVTAKGANITAASVVHPTERRKFTIDELKIVSSFPADFKLNGTFSQQWERIGRAVPPLMARAVAEVVRDEVLAKCAV